MKIHAGYEISYDCPQPTPMILQLSVHPSRTPDLLTWDRVRLDPPIAANTYHDVFGNFCHVIRAPAGRLTMSTDLLVQDKGARARRHRRRDRDLVRPVHADGLQGDDRRSRSNTLRLTHNDRGLALRSDHYAPYIKAL